MPTRPEMITDHLTTTFGRTVCIKECTYGKQQQLWPETRPTGAQPEEQWQEAMDRTTSLHRVQAAARLPQSGTNNRLYVINRQHKYFNPLSKDQYKTATEGAVLLTPQHDIPPYFMPNPPSRLTATHPRDQKPTNHAATPLAVWAFWIHRMRRAIKKNKKLSYRRDNNPQPKSIFYNLTQVQYITYVQ